jgi:hypothetical protein
MTSVERQSDFRTEPGGVSACGVLRGLMRRHTLFLGPQDFENRVLNVLHVLGAGVLVGEILRFDHHSRTCRTCKTWLHYLSTRKREVRPLRA